MHHVFIYLLDCVQLTDE